jgi:phospholipase C
MSDRQPDHAGSGEPTGDERPGSRPTSPFTRRRLRGAAARGAASASPALPTNVRKALADPPSMRNAAVGDIEHVVLLMQENRSFDHYFGTMPGVRGFGDATALVQANGKSVFYQTDPYNPDGYLLPYHLDTLTTGAQAIPSTSHAWSVQHSAWHGGAMDNWVGAHYAADGAKIGPFTMGYYERRDIPFQWALADAFTVCDNYFCAVLGPTHPNRYMWLTGTIDPDGMAGGPALDNGTMNGSYFWRTYAENLTDAGVSWKCYQESDNFGTNILEFMKQFQDAPTSSPLFQNAMTIQPAGQFELDAITDNLPTVSWIFPTSVQSEHPAYLPAAGAAFVASKIDAIAANPEVWAKTVFLLVYDENDGLFDHVPPPVSPAGTPDEYVAGNSPAGTVGGGLPVGPGFRVPCIIVSPWTAGGWVHSEPSDHTSHLMFLEQVTGVPAPNISAYRRQTMSNLTGAFRFSSFAEAPVLPDTSGPLTLAQYTSSQFPLPAFPGADQTPPFQPPGHRPHVP